MISHLNRATHTKSASLCMCHQNTVEIFQQEVQGGLHVPYWDSVGHMVLCSSVLTVLAKRRPKSECKMGIPPPEFGIMRTNGKLHLQFRPNSLLEQPQLELFNRIAAMYGIVISFLKAFSQGKFIG